MNGSFRPGSSLFASLSFLLATALVGFQPSDVPDEPADPPPDTLPADETSVGELPPQGILAIEGVAVISTAVDEILRDRTVVIRDGRIAAVGPAGEVQVPDDAERIEGEGRYLMPGMAEMHGHLPGGGADPEFVQRVLFLYVANGVTLVRGMQGHPDQLVVRDDIAAGRMLGPRLLVSSPAQGWANAPDASEASTRARDFARAGYDLIKVGEDVSADAYQALVAAAREEGIPLAGHVPDDVGLFGALEAGQVTIDHLDNYVEALIPEQDRADIPALWGVARVADRAREDRIPRLVSATVEAGTAQVPTMVLWETFFGDRSGEELLEAFAEVRYMPRGTVDGWVEGLASLKETIGAPEGALGVVELRRDIFRALHQGGATFLLGTDSPQLFSVPGFSNHREMALWVELGMAPWEVIRAGTRAVAEHLGALDEFGDVREGLRADLILLEANPTEDVGNVALRAGVIVDGRWLPEEEIQRRLEALAW